MQRLLGAWCGLLVQDDGHTWNTNEKQRGVPEEAVGHSANYRIGSRESAGGLSGKGEAARSCVPRAGTRPRRHSAEAVRKCRLQSLSKRDDDAGAHSPEVNRRPSAACYSTVATVTIWMSSPRSTSCWKSLSAVRRRARDASATLAISKSRM